MAILESHHFRLPICRFVIDLFDKSVLRQIVLDEEEDDSEEESSDEDEVAGARDPFRDGLTNGIASV